MSDERTLSLDLPNIFGMNLFLSVLWFWRISLTGLYGPGIWVSDLYGLTGRVQAVNTVLGVSGFFSFCSGIKSIASHHIAAGTLGILAGLFHSIFVSLRPNVYTKAYVWGGNIETILSSAVFFPVVAGTMWYGSATTPRWNSLVPLVINEIQDTSNKKDIEECVLG